MTDGSGNAVNSYTYDAWGDIVSQTETVSNPIKYAGEYYDDELGMYYLRARYYDPKIGRFIQSDPIESGLNWYAYCENNPIMFVDPSGYLNVGYDENGIWHDWDAETYGADSVAYSALLTLTSMWNNRPDDREAISRLASMVRNTANGFGYEAKLQAVNLIDPQSANEVDIILAVAYPVKATRANELKEDAVRKANELYGQDSDGTIHNAFKHAYWNALMAYYLGDDYAQLVGYSHEFGAPENLKPENYENMNMDLYNNYVGRDIAWNYTKLHWYSKPKKEMSDKVQNAAENGYLVILR